MPSAIQENKGERPYFPRVFILAEQKSCMLMDFEMYESIIDDAIGTINKLINICLGKGIPKEIWAYFQTMSFSLKVYE